MDKNYYEVLGLCRNASQQQIASKYKQLVLRWHPKFAKQDQKTAQYHFSQISEAYQVLSDPLKRSFFDKYGWKKLKDGLFQQGQLKGGYRFGNNPDEIFQKFFLKNNIFTQSIDKKVLQRGSLFSHSFGALNYVDQNPIKDLVVHVPCRLEQLYSGVAKLVTYDRVILNKDGRTLSKQQQTKLIQIKPGHSKQTQLVYKQCGNQNIERKKTNLIFKIIQIPHDFFERSGNDLYFKARISLDQALACQPIQIVTLDNRKLTLSIDQVPNPKLVRQVSNEGMPIFNKRAKGNLLVKFDIQFPKTLSEETRKELREILH